jgi:hypothetical protein
LELECFILVTVAWLRRIARRTSSGSDFISTTCAVSIATSVPAPIAMPTSALGEGRRVVHPVADHGDDLPLGLEPLHVLGLVLEQDLGEDALDPQLPRPRRASAAR